MMLHIPCSSLEAFEFFSTDLPAGDMVFAGFLKDEDVTQNYRVAVPYISNPFTTMDQTTREIARRYIAMYYKLNFALGNKSFFV